MHESDARAAAAEAQEVRADVEMFTVQQLRAMDRLDDEHKELRGEMREGFQRVDGDLKDLRGEMKEGFAKVDERFARNDDRFDKVDERFTKVDERFDKVQEEFTSVRSEMHSGFDRMQRTLIAIASAIIAALIASPHL